MSRVGKKPISLPQGVTVDLQGQEVSIRGPRGALGMALHPQIQARVENGELFVERPNDQRQVRALHGTMRSLLQNMVTGVSEGFRRSLVIEGVGYQAEMRGQQLLLKLGHSHEVLETAPEGVTFEVPKEGRGRLVHVDGIDKQVVGQVAAQLRKWRPPEPYKGKGIRYSDEIVRRKAGKAGKTI
ncbi:MAG: 50S ribosomal protein L6 [Anaerolineaceae bacterium]|nr:50S ribosomal protein L6 [Anaerolineaceae bacterium]MCY4009363.1 50S ribosomal protein L6 [Anaerolineaceae bacterium]MCY4106296.1 50S ribosomal protein L6 [Chloroflexota bacterium]